jgi:hypothetical protein
LLLDEEHPLLFEIVQFKVVVPQYKSDRFTVDVGELGLFTVTPPLLLTIVHDPVSFVPGAFPVSVPTFVPGQDVNPPLAVAVVIESTLTTTSWYTKEPSEQVVDIRKVYEFPPECPVTVVVKLFGELMITAGPATCDHVVVPAP